jgi:F-type H+-transporting ATPase subunit epsilon
VKPFRLLILTPYGTAFSGGVEYLEVPASDGRMAVLADHASMIAILAAGEIRARIESGLQMAWLIEDGFVQVFQNEAAILTPRATSR